MQISYHFALTKIQKLQNFKNNNNKKKNFFSVLAGTLGIARNWPVRPVFFPVRNRGVECTGLLVGTIYSGRTGRYGTELITLNLTQIKSTDLTQITFLLKIFAIDIFFQINLLLL